MLKPKKSPQKNYFILRILDSFIITLYWNKSSNYFFSLFYGEKFNWFYNLCGELLFLISLLIIIIFMLKQNR